MTPKLVLRFDIDTFRCMKHGVRNLLELAREMQVSFTFFCNMGRAVSRKDLLKRLVTGGAASPALSRTKLPIAVKQGYYHLLLTLFMNPMVGMSQPGLLRRACEEGHDIGLHGGRNHGEWQHGFRYWTRARIEREIAAGTSMFERVLNTPPRIFSSPGWQGSPELDSVLKSRGFTASANRHGPGENGIELRHGLATLPTNLVGEPGGVAYFEHSVARGLGEREITEEFRKTLNDGRELYVLYDHPCFAGVSALDTVRAVMRSAIDQGVEITTYSSLIKQYKLAG